MTEIRSLSFLKIGIAIFKAWLMASWIAPCLFILTLIFGPSQMITTENLDLVSPAFFTSYVIGGGVSFMYAYVILTLITYGAFPFTNSYSFPRLLASSWFLFCLPLILLSILIAVNSLDAHLIYYILISAWAQALSVLGIYCWLLNRLLR